MSIKTALVAASLAFAAVTPASAQTLPTPPPYPCDAMRPQGASNAYIIGWYRGCNQRYQIELQRWQAQMTYLETLHQQQQLDELRMLNEHQKRGDYDK